MEIKEKNKWTTQKFKALSQEDLSHIKGGGYWIYDKGLDKWVWIEKV